MIKSPRNAKKIELPSTKSANQQPIDSPEVQRILSIKDNFKKNVEIPIENIEKIDQSKSPQRCLLHNAVFTLYCEIDRKPLCASCMYQQETHRKHRVTPLHKSLNMVKEDIIALENKLEGNLNQCAAISKKLQQTIIKNERQFPMITQRLKQFYANLYMMLKQKEKEQVAQILEQKEKVRREITFLDQQVKRIAGIIINKIKPVMKAESEDLMMCRRGTLEALSKVNKIINSEITDFFPEDDKQRMIDFNLYNDISQMLKTRLVLVLPGISHQSKSGRLFNVSSPKNVTPSPKNNDKSKTKNEVFRSVSANKKQRKQVTFDLQ